MLLSLENKRNLVTQITRYHYCLAINETLVEAETTTVTSTTTTTTTTTTESNIQKPEGTCGGWGYRGSLFKQKLKQVISRSQFQIMLLHNIKS